VARVVRYSIGLRDTRPVVTVSTGDVEVGPVTLTKQAFTQLRTWTTNLGLPDAVAALDQMVAEVITDLQTQEAVLRAAAVQATATAADDVARADQIKAAYTALQ
jgi:hypothetical protein